MTLMGLFWHRQRYSRRYVRQYVLRRGHAKASALSPVMKGRLIVVEPLRGLGIRENLHHQGGRTICRQAMRGQNDKRTEH